MRIKYYFLRFKFLASVVFREEGAVETMQTMTRELEETTAAMKEERDKLEAARQELQNIARRLPLAKPDAGIFTTNERSECESFSLKPASPVSVLNSRSALSQTSR